MPSCAKQMNMMEHVLALQFMLCRAEAGTCCTVEQDKLAALYRQVYLLRQNIGWMGLGNKPSGQLLFGTGYSHHYTVK